MVELDHKMLWFESKFGAKIGQKNDGFCPLKIGQNIDDIAKEMEWRGKSGHQF